VNPGELRPWRAAEQPSSPAIRHRAPLRVGFSGVFCIFVVPKLYAKSLSQKTFMFVDKRFKKIEHFF
jgi:hypothetical protein